MLHAVDAVVLRVPDLDRGLAFYQDGLGHRLLWRSEDSCGLAMAGSATELVLSTRLAPETDLRVQSAVAAAERFQAGGGRIIAGPDEIAIGSVVVVADPFGNRLVLLDSAKGRLLVDEAGHAIGVTPREAVDRDASPARDPRPSRRRGGGGDRHAPAGASAPARRRDGGRGARA